MLDWLFPDLDDLPEEALGCKSSPSLGNDKANLSRIDQKNTLNMANERSDSVKIHIFMGETSLISILLSELCHFESKVIY